MWAEPPYGAFDDVTRRRPATAGRLLNQEAHVDRNDPIDKNDPLLRRDETLDDATPGWTPVEGTVYEPLDERAPAPDLEVDHDHDPDEHASR